MGDVLAWDKQGHAEDVPPTLILRPCDYQMALAWTGLETQLGTIEAYNRLCRIAYDIKRRIDAGDIKAQNPCYTKSVTGATP